MKQDIEVAQNAAKALLKEALGLLDAKKPQGATDTGRFFFPNGIDLIDVQVKVQSVEIHLIVSGSPKTGLAHAANEMSK